MAPELTEQVFRLEMIKGQRKMQETLDKINGRLHDGDLKLQGHDSKIETHGDSLSELKASISRIEGAVNKMAIEQAQWQTKIGVLWAVAGSGLGIGSASLVAVIVSILRQH